MLYGSAIIIKKLSGKINIDNPTIEDWAAYNSSIESFAIHIRILSEVLYSQNPRPDDIIAEDYLNNPESWPQIRPPMPTNLQGIFNKSSKLANHLTYERVTMDRQWEVKEITESFDKVLLCFLKNTDESRLDKAFIEFIKRNINSQPI